MSFSQVWRSLATSSLLLGLASGGAAAEMPMEHAQPTQQFRRIEQPLSLKVGVTLAGVGLVGLELWWFLGHKTRSRQAVTNQGIQEITVTVDGGYDPARVVVQTGQLVRLKFDRRDPSNCLDQVRLPDFRIVQDLPLHQVTAVEFTPAQPGEYPFTCGMNMFRGVIEVQPAAAPAAIAPTTIASAK
jgi:plastocyanin domain-containing protein